MYPHLIQIVSGTLTPDNYLVRKRTRIALSLSPNMHAHALKKCKPRSIKRWKTTCLGTAPTASPHSGCDSTHFSFTLTIWYPTRTPQGAGASRTFSILNSVMLDTSLSLRESRKHFLDGALSVKPLGGDYYPAPRPRSPDFERCKRVSRISLYDRARRAIQACLNTR